jgi:hypothetical protein
VQAAIVADRIRIGGRALYFQHWDPQLRKACPLRDVRTVGHDAAESMTAFCSSTHWLIMSHEPFVELTTHGLLVGRDEQVVLLTCDEAHTICNLKTYKTSEVATLPKRHSLLLTGTPAANDPKCMGLYSQPDSPSWQRRGRRQHAVLGLARICRRTARGAPAWRGAEDSAGGPREESGSRRAHVCLCRGRVTYS